MPRVRTKPSPGQSSGSLSSPGVNQLPIPLDDGTAMLALIQELIPLGLRAVEEPLAQEVRKLAGARYSHDDAHPHLVRWGRPPGSVFLLDQKLPIEVPRVRDRASGHEVALSAYSIFRHRVRSMLVFSVVCRAGFPAANTRLRRKQCRLARSSVSRRFIRASSRALQIVLNRRLDDREWLALVADGKSFAKDGIVIALG